VRIDWIFSSNCYERIKPVIRLILKFAEDKSLDFSLLEFAPKANDSQMAGMSDDSRKGGPMHRVILPPGSLFMEQACGFICDFWSMTPPEKTYCAFGGFVLRPDICSPPNGTLFFGLDGCT